MLLPSRSIPKLHFVSNEMSQTCTWLVFTLQFLLPYLTYILSSLYSWGQWYKTVSNVFLDCSWIKKHTKQQQQLVKVGVKCSSFLSYQYKTLIIYLIFEWKVRIPPTRHILPSSTTNLTAWRQFVLVACKQRPWRKGQGNI